MSYPYIPPMPPAAPVGAPFAPLSPPAVEVAERIASEEPLASDKGGKALVKAGALAGMRLRAVDHAALADAWATHFREGGAPNEADGCAIVAREIRRGDVDGLRAPAPPPVRFVDLQQQLARLKRTLGPWQPHKHGFGCECGHYQGNHPMRGDWWYRPAVLDAKDGIVSFTAEGRAEADAKAIASGFTLIDTP